MESSLVSIIVPTFNRADLIADAVGSVLKQTYRHFEIIVVDDGSTDNTRAVVKSLGGPIKYFYKNNSGPSATRNMGIANAQGTYVAFLDSDDLWEPDKLEKQIRCFEQNPEAAMVTSNYRYIDRNNNVIKEPGAGYGYTTQGHRVIEDMLNIGFPFATITFMIRKAVFDQVGVFKEHLRTAEDLDLLIRIALKYQIVYIDEVLASVRLHENHSMRETPRYQVWLNSVRVYESHVKAIAAVVAQPRKYFANFYSIAGNSALLSGERLKALECHFKAVLNRPLHPKGYKDCIRCFLPMGYLKRRYEASLKVAIPDVLKNYQ